MRYYATLLYRCGHTENVNKVPYLYAKPKQNAALEVMTHLLQRKRTAAILVRYALLDRSKYQEASSEEDIHNLFLYKINYHDILKHILIYIYDM